MEPSIYKPGAYKTPGVYKGAGGIYKGRGVYNDGAQEFVEIGGKKYPVVTIGSLKWIAKNLDWNFDENGTYYDNDAATYGPSGLDFGLLYLWSSVDSLNSLLPPGWRVATRSDFSNLFSEVSNQASNLKINTMWGYPGTNGVNWNGVPSGHYSAYLEKYEGAYMNPNGALLGMDFWTSEEASSSYSYDVYYRENNASFSNGSDRKDDRYSVRIVKDA